MKYCIWYLWEKYDKYREVRGHRHLTQPEFSKIVLSMDIVKKQKEYNKEKVLFYKNVDSLENNETKNWWSFAGIALKSSISTGKPSVNFNFIELSSDVENDEKNTKPSVPRQIFPPDALIAPQHIFPLVTLGSIEKPTKIQERESLLKIEEKHARFLPFTLGFCNQEYFDNLSTYIKNNQSLGDNIAKISMNFCQTSIGKIAFNEIGLEQIKKDIKNLVKKNSFVLSEEQGLKILEKEGY